MVWKKRQIIAVAQARAVAQASLGGKEAEEAFKDFIAEITQEQSKKEQDSLRDKLTDLTKIQAIKFRPLDPLTKTKQLKKVKKS